MCAHEYTFFINQLFLQHFQCQTLQDSSTPVVESLVGASSFQRCRFSPHSSYLCQQWRSVAVRTLRANFPPAAKSLWCDRLQEKQIFSDLQDNSGSAYTVGEKFLWGGSEFKVKSQIVNLICLVSGTFRVFRRSASCGTGEKSFNLDLNQPITKLGGWFWVYCLKVDHFSLM